MNKGERRSKAEFDILRRIREECDKRGWTDYELAENSELAQSTISTWYSRDIEPGVASIEKICAGLGITLSQFFQKDGFVFLAMPACFRRYSGVKSNRWNKRKLWPS